MSIAKGIAFLFRRKPPAAQFMANLTVASIVLVIVSINLSALRCWLFDGRENGDRLEGLMPYVLDWRNIPDYKWYFVTRSEAASVSDCFLPWTGASECKNLLCVIANGEPEVHTIEPKKFCEELPKGLLDGGPFKPPLTIFLIKNCCPHIDTLLPTQFELRPHYFTKRGMYEAVEILK